MNKYLVIDYGRLKTITKVLSLISAPFVFILGYNMYDLKCSGVSIHAANYIFYLFFFTLQVSLFIQFLLHFEEFHRDKLVLSVLNLLFLIYYIIQLLVFAKIISLLLLVKEKCEELNNFDFIGGMLLLLINTYTISKILESFWNLVNIKQKYFKNK